MLNPSIREPRWWLIPLRVALVTFLGTLCCFALSLLVGIVTIAAGAWLRGVHPDLTIAYRHVAIPAAAVFGVTVLLAMSVFEIRRYQQTKLLARIERIG
jgi:hypothetical protein